MSVGADDLSDSFVCMFNDAVGCWGMRRGGVCFIPVCKRNAWKSFLNSGPLSWITFVGLGYRESQ